MAARKDLSKLTTALAAGTGIALLVGLLQAVGAFEPLELRMRDVRTRWTVPEKGGHPDIVLAMITDESIRYMEEENKIRWPWTREAYACMFRGFALGKASAILCDLLLLDLNEGEQEMAEQMGRSPPVFLPAAFRIVEPNKEREKKRADREAVLRKFAIEVQNDGSVAVPERYEWVILPRPTIVAAAAGICDVSTQRDSDALIRRYQLYSAYEGRIYPSFALAALMTHEGVRRVVIRDRVLQVGRISIPLERDGTIGLRYYRPKTGSWKVIPASHVIGGVGELESGGKSKTFHPGDFERKFVLVGSALIADVDLKVTPVAQEMWGTEIQAIALGNILNGDFLREAPVGLGVLIVFLLSVGVALVTRFASAGVGGVAALGFFLGAGGVNVAFYKARWVVGVVPQLVAVGLAYAGASALNFLYEGRQRLRVKREFQRYLSPKVVEKILKIPDALSLEGERKMLTVFFMDFAGFTSMSEKLDPAELVKLISEYHHEAAEEIFRTEGTVDKYIGDAIMAFWNDPIDQPDHALRACLSAVAAQKRLRQMAVMMKERGLPEMRARIGINTGIATVGNMGAKGQVNYTVIGDEVNLASRLEGVNKEFGTDVIVSEATYGPAKDRLDARELALIKVKGKKLPVRIFELLGVRGEVPAERLEAARSFEKALADFRARKFQEAWQSFLTLSQKKDRAAEPYLSLCERYLGEPPPADWDGSYQMETK